MDTGPGSNSEQPHVNTPSEVLPGNDVNASSGLVGGIGRESIAGAEARPESETVAWIEANGQPQDDQFDPAKADVENFNEIVRRVNETGSGRLVAVFRYPDGNSNFENIGNLSDYISARNFQALIDNPDPEKRVIVRFYSWPEPEKHIEQ
jgi:hypothetical protein